MRQTLLAAAIASAFVAACSMTTHPDTAQAPPPPRDESGRADLAKTGDAEVAAEATAENQDRRGSDAAGVLAPQEKEELDAIVVSGSRIQPVAPPPAIVFSEASPMSAPVAGQASAPARSKSLGYAQSMPQPVERNTENYESLPENPVVVTAENPVSTFSIDVDTGSYTNVRSLLAQNQRPPADAVRAEEMINYFDYGYPGPDGRDTPFRVSTEIAPAPWDSHRLLLQVGIQGYRVPQASIPAANLVFLIDTSGSMDEPDKLPLLRDSFKQMVATLRARDRVSIVVYAGSAGLVLPPTSGADKETILAALDRLSAGGSTNGGEGLQLAYAMAERARIEGGVNRVILATDGDFNVGTFDQQALETMIGDKRKSGIALTTLGFGRGNYNDAMAERLADVGNGNHAYVDTIGEGRRVLVEEMSSTILTIAQDVKIQMEFNPAVVAEYRLIGYENRALRREDFNNDRIDAGEIGAGHDVTALYEIALVGSGGERSDPLRYSDRAEALRSSTRTAATGTAGELGHLRLRYKLPGTERSKLIATPLSRDAIRAQPSERLRFAASVAAYADLLRGGGNLGAFGWAQVHDLAKGALGRDEHGRRREFLALIDDARRVTGGEAAVAISED
jgi:Ca-activated chloride channel family protein